MPSRTNLLAVLTIVAGIVAQLLQVHQPDPGVELAARHVAPMTVLGRDRIVVTGGDGAVLQDIEAVVDRFEEAGLPLPAGLIVHIHATRDSCEGHMGLYGSGGDGLRVDLCEPHQAVIRHELAHAWERHNVDDETRRAFMDLFGLKAWNDHALSHPARGVEQAANLVSWALRDEPIQAISFGAYDDKLDACYLLTGRQSPRIADIAAPSSGQPPVRSSQAGMAAGRATVARSSPRHESVRRL